MSIKTVGIIGAGAVGSYVIWGLSKVEDIKLGVIAKGERNQKLKADGCKINGNVYRPEVWTPDEAKGVDLLIVSLKYGALPEALDDIKAATGDNTIVMSLMNGVDSEDVIAEKIGASHMLYSLIKVASAYKEGKGYVFNPETTLGIIYGELNPPFNSDRVNAVKELFESGSIHFRVTEHIKEEIWCKFRLNVCNNLPQAILGAGVGCYRDSVHMKAISEGLRKELEEGKTPEYVCKYCLFCVADTVVKMTKAAQKEYPGLPVVCAGGVMSSDIIRAWVQQRLPQVYFVPGQYSSDNAIGVSILAAQGAGLWLK